MRAIRTALIMAAIATAILFAFGSLLQAAPVVRAIQTVSVQSCNGRQCTQVRKLSPGSGVCVGRDKAGRLLVLTCAHGWTAKGPTVAIIDGDTPEKAAIVGFDGAKDLCLLAIDHPAQTQVYPISSTVPAVGTQVITQGFPNAAKFRTVPTRIVGYTGNCMITAATFRQGESGGAVVCGNELVGIIQATSHADGASAHVRSIQDFMLASLGYQPIIAAPPAEKPAEVPPPKLLPEPHPDPLPSPPAAEVPVPVPTGASADDVRSIVGGELSKLGPDIKAELVKQLQLHGTDLKQAVTASVAEGKINPAAFTPILQSAAQGAAQDVSQKVAEQVVPSLLTAIASHLGMGALAGSVGGPIGALAGGAIALAGFFLNRTLKKRLPLSGASPLQSGSTSVPLPQLQPATAAQSPAPANIIQSVPPAINIPDAGQFEDLLQACNAEVQNNPQLINRIFNSFKLFQQGRSVSASKTSS